MKEMFFTGHLF